MTDDEIEALKDELMATISGLGIEVAKLKDELNGLESRIERLDEHEQ